MSKLVPNSFQHPNIFIDQLAYFLTPAEQAVLNKAVREILGWQDKIEDRRARIALSVFVEGKFDRATGERLCYGCGLSEGTVRKALQELDKFNILVKEGNATQDGQLFRLVNDPDEIDWAALEVRRAKRNHRNVARTEEATQASLEARGVTSIEGVTSDVRGNVNCTQEVTSDVAEGVTSDVDKETHGKPNRNPIIAAGEKSAGEQELEKFLGPRKREVKPTGKGPPHSAEEFRERVMESHTRMLARAGAEPWRNWSDGAFKTWHGVEVDTQEHVAWLVDRETGLRPIDGEGRFWGQCCAQVYQAGGGDWQVIEAGIKAVWQRDPKYRPGHAKGFINAVRKAGVSESHQQPIRLSQW
jgi:hypothetical protein